MKKLFLYAGIIVITLIFSTNLFNQTTSEGLIASNSNEKILICHVPPGNPDNAHPIEININALNGHLAHGDRMGICNPYGPIEPPIIIVVPKDPDTDTSGDPTGY